MAPLGCTHHTAVVGSSPGAVDPAGVSCRAAVTSAVNTQDPGEAA